MHSLGTVGHFRTTKLMVPYVFQLLLAKSQKFVLFRLSRPLIFNFDNLDFLVLCYFAEYMTYKPPPTPFSMPIPEMFCINETSTFMLIGRVTIDNNIAATLEFETNDNVAFLMSFHIDLNYLERWALRLLFSIFFHSKESLYGLFTLTDTLGVSGIQLFDCLISSKNRSGYPGPVLGASLPKLTSSNVH